MWINTEQNFRGSTWRPFCPLSVAVNTRLAQTALAKRSNILAMLPCSQSAWHQDLHNVRDVGRVDHKEADCRVRCSRLEHNTQKHLLLETNRRFFYPFVFRLRCINQTQKHCVYHKHHSLAHSSAEFWILIGQKRFTHLPQLHNNHAQIRYSFHGNIYCKGYCSHSRKKIK